MQYKFSVWELRYNHGMLINVYETYELARKHASEINERGIRLAYISEIKVYGGYEG